MRIFDIIQMHNKNSIKNKFNPLKDKGISLKKYEHINFDNILLSF